LNITLWFIIGYFIITAAVCWFSRGKEKNAKEFFVASSQLPWFLLVPLLLSEYLHATATVGTVEKAHDTGIAAFWFFFGTFLGFIVFTFTLVKFYTYIKRISIGEAFAVLFDQKTRLACVIFLFVPTAFNSAAAYLALGSFLSPLLNLPYEGGVWVSAAVITLLALIGLRGIAVMNFLHLFTIFFGFGIAAIAALTMAGGPTSLIASLPSEFMDFGQMGWQSTLSWVITSGTSPLSGIIVVAAIFAARDERTAKIATVSTGIGVLLFGMLPIIIGLSAYALMPDIPSRIALFEMGETFGVTVSSILSLGVTAAVVSTTPAMLLSLGAIATRDFFLLIKPDASDLTQVALTRVVIVVLVITTTLFALTQPTIMGMVVNFMQVRIIVVAVLLISVLWRPIHPFAAFFTILIGSSIALLWVFLDSPFGIEPLWPSLAVGLVTLLVSSYFKKSEKQGSAGWPQVDRTWS